MRGGAWATWCFVLVCLWAVLGAVGAADAAAALPAEYDYYEVLGLERDATAASLKKSFRALSLQYHPDQHQGDNHAAAMFNRVSEAYEVLSSPDKRYLYDLHGKRGVQEAATAKQGVDALMDTKSRKGPSMIVHFTVDIEDLNNGITQDFVFKRKVLCPKCRGYGGDPKGPQVPCKRCFAKGVVPTLLNMGNGISVQKEGPCPVCKGRAEVPKVKCEVCKGELLKQEDVTLNIIVEKGAPEGHNIVFEGMSEATVDFLPGDVIVEVISNPHPIYTRDKVDPADLHMNYNMTMREALLGFSKTVTHLGRELTITREGVTQHDHVEVIEGEGLPVHEAESEAGKLHLHFKLALPTEPLTLKQKNVIKHFNF